MNKRGGFMQDNLGSIIMVVIIVLIGVIIYIGFYYESEPQYQELRSCNVIGLGNGVCRDVEDENCYKLGACPKETAYCCISLEEKEKSILPATYGGNANYDFTVGYIGPATKIENGKNIPPGAKDQCIFDNSYQASMECKENTALAFDIKIKVVNKGRAIIPVKASPYLVYNDDPNRISTILDTKELILNTSKSTKTLPDGTVVTLDNGEVTARVNIAAKDAVAGNYVKIYPYALCDKRDCKREDPRGILRNNLDPEGYMVIKFIKKTP